MHYLQWRNENNNNCWVPESTKNNQHKITTNIGKRNLSGAQSNKQKKTEFP